MHFPPAHLHWGVIAVLASGQGIGTCGHQHATADDAAACAWTPEPWPEVCDLLVREMRTLTPPELEHRRARRAQLSMELG